MGKKLAVVMTAAIVPTLAACSSGGSDAAGTASGNDIKVGVICTCSGLGGQGAVNQFALKTYQAWTSHVNDAGGIDGHKVQLIVIDDAGNPGNALNAAKKVVKEGVAAVADISLLDQTFQSALEKAQIPVVGGLSFETPFGTSPIFYPATETSESSAYAVGQVAKAAGAKNFGLLYCAEVPNCAQSVDLFKAAGVAAGVPLIYSAAIAASAPNYTAPCLAAKQQGVEALQIAETAFLLNRVATDCVNQEYRPIFTSEGAGWSKSELSAPGLKDNSWVEFPSLPFFADTPAVREARDAMAKYAPGVMDTDDGYNGGSFMLWASGKLLEKAVKASGVARSAAPTPASVIKGLESLKGETLDGLTGPLTFTPGKPHPHNCWFTVQITGGKPIIKNGNEATCRPEGA
jgi:branched-chain amino acid transport system substrate-binding protein